MADTNRYRATGLEQAIETQGRRKEWVAARGGVSPSHIAHVLAGRRTVTEDVAVRITQAMGVPLFFAFQLTDGSTSLPVSNEAIPA